MYVMLFHLSMSCSFVSIQKAVFLPDKRKGNRFDILAVNGDIWSFDCDTPLLAKLWVTRINDVRTCGWASRFSATTIVWTLTPVFLSHRRRNGRTSRLSWTCVRGRLPLQ
jgi:hypothetical protein